jgi:hypothetical protein
MGAPHKEPDRLRLREAQTTAALPLIEWAKMIDIKRIPNRYTVIPKEALYLRPRLVRIAKAQFPPPTPPLQDHRIPPFEFEIAPACDERADGLCLPPIGTVVEVNLLHVIP